jgi:hypothetical protein
VRLNRPQTATCSRWFLARGFFYPEDGGDTFLRNVGSHKIYTEPHPRIRHSSWYSLLQAEHCWDILVKEDEMGRVSRAHVRDAKCTKYFNIKTWRVEAFGILRTGGPLPQGIFLVLISVRGWVDQSSIVRQEGLGQLKNPVDSSEIEPVNFQLLA